MSTGTPGGRGRRQAGLLTVDLERRSRYLRRDHLEPVGAHVKIPTTTIEQMIVYGRWEFDHTSVDLNPGQLWQRIQTIADPERFCRELAARTLPVGGWAVYGTQRLVAELLGGDYAGLDFLAEQDAALDWLHSNGVSSARLTGYESSRWWATHGPGSW